MGSPGSRVPPSRRYTNGCWPLGSCWPWSCAGINCSSECTQAWRSAPAELYSPCGQAMFAHVSAIPLIRGPFAGRGVQIEIESHYSTQSARAAGTARGRRPQQARQHRLLARCGRLQSGDDGRPTAGAQRRAVHDDRAGVARSREFDEVIRGVRVEAVNDQFADQRRPGRVRGCARSRMPDQQRVRETDSCRRKSCRQPRPGSSRRWWP